MNFFRDPAKARERAGLTQEALASSALTPQMNWDTLRQLTRESRIVTEPISPRSGWSVRDQSLALIKRMPPPMTGTYSKSPCAESQ